MPIILAERVSVTPPLKDKAFSTFLDQNPPFELPPEKRDFVFGKNLSVQWTVVDNSAIKRLAKGKLPSHHRYIFEIPFSRRAFEVTVTVHKIIVSQRIEAVTMQLPIISEESFA